MLDLWFLSSVIVSEEAFPLALFIIQIVAVSVTEKAAVFTFSGVLRGAEDTLFTMILSATMHWTMAVSIYLVLNKFNGTLHGAWMISVATFFSMGVVFYLRYRNGKW